jgi:hypothetical protein
MDSPVPAEGRHLSPLMTGYRHCYTLVPIPLGWFDVILLAKILCHRGLFDEYRPSESAS